MTKVKVDIGGEDIVTVIVTDAALKELGAKVGEELEVLKPRRSWGRQRFALIFSNARPGGCFCRRGDSLPVEHFPISGDPHHPK